MNKVQSILFGLVIAIFLVTRFYQIGSTPNSVYWDEASIGYNAYSVLTTGKDEWGKNFPIHFRAFGEFKLPVFIYTVAVSEWLFGLNSIALRVPAVLFSLGTLILVFMLSLKLTKNSITSLFSSIFLILSPWFFIFSRVGYEATAGLFFYILGIYLIMYKNKYLILLSSISFILSMYSYNSFRIITPLTLLILGILNGKEYLSKKNLLVTLFAVIIFAVSTIPILKLYLLDSGDARFQAVSISAPNKIVESEIFVENYLSHYAPNFLFLSGDNQPRFSIPGYGELFIVELPFLIFGLIYALKKRQFLVLLIILIGPIPAALTKEAPHALRSIASLPFLSILAGLGVGELVNIDRRIFKAILGGLTIILLISFGIYFKDFLQKYEIDVSKDWQYAYEQIYQNYSGKFDNYNQIWISDQYAQPYVFALYYLKYNPESFHQSVSYNDVSDWGFSTVNSFGKFHFFKEAKTTTFPTNSLVFTLTKPENNTSLLGTIYLMNNQKGLDVYETK